MVRRKRRFEISFPAWVSSICYDFGGRGNVENHLIWSRALSLYAEEHGVDSQDLLYDATKSPTRDEPPSPDLISRAIDVWAADPGNLHTPRDPRDA